MNEPMNGMAAARVGSDALSLEPRMLSGTALSDDSARPLVLHVRCVSETGGGPEKTILNSPRFLEPLGYRSKCAYMHPPTDGSLKVLQEHAGRAHATLLPIADRGPFDLSVLFRLIRLCRRERVTIWHGHDYKSNAIGLVAKRFWPMKLVTTVHGWVRHTRRTPIYYAVDKWSLRRYDAVACVSEDLHEECLRLGVPRSRCCLIRNGIDTQDYQRQMDTRQARMQLGLPVSGTLIGAAGRLSPEKGFDLLIRAVHQLHVTGNDVTLWIAGDGEAREDLQKLATQLGFGQRIQFLGHQPDLRTFYQALDVFALSSLREGLPNVLLEAMALEVPVVATRIAGIPALVQHEQNGLLMEPGSEQALVAALSQLVAQPAQRIALATRARKTIEKDFSFQRRMEKMVQLYARMLAGQPVDAPDSGGLV